MLARSVANLACDGVVKGLHKDGVERAATVSTSGKIAEAQYPVGTAFVIITWASSGTKLQSNRD